MDNSGGQLKIDGKSQGECREYIFDMLSQLSVLANQIGEVTTAANIQNALLSVEKQNKKISKIVSPRG